MVEAGVRFPCHLLQYQPQQKENSQGPLRTAPPGQRVLSGEGRQFGKARSPGAKSPSWKKGEKGV